MKRRGRGSAEYAPIPALRPSVTPSPASTGTTLADSAMATNLTLVTADILFGVLLLPGVTHVFRSPSPLSRWFDGSLTGIEQQPDGSLIVTISIGLDRRAQPRWTIGYVRAFIHAQFLARGVEEADIRVRVVLFS